MKLSYCHHRHANTDTAALALEIEGLNVSYPGEEKLALQDFNARVPVGQSVALVGPNGAGKSTLFKAILGFLKVRSGTLRIFGHSLGACHHRVVYLPQRSEIVWDFPVDVLDFVMSGRYVHLGWFQRPSREDKIAAIENLRQLGVEDLKDRQIRRLSGGQQQRVLIARALTQEADLLLLDEPLNAVDAATRDIVDGVLKKIRRDGKTVVVATHYFDREEGRYDQAIYLKDGELSCCH